MGGTPGENWPSDTMMGSISPASFLFLRSKMPKDWLLSPLTPTR